MRCNKTDVFPVPMPLTEQDVFVLTTRLCSRWIVAVMACSFSVLTLRAADGREDLRWQPLCQSRVLVARDVTVGSSSSTVLFLTVYLVRRSTHLRL